MLRTVSQERVCVCVSIHQKCSLLAERFESPRTTRRGCRGLTWNRARRAHVYSSTFVRDSNSKTRIPSGRKKHTKAFGCGEFIYQQPACFSCTITNETKLLTLTKQPYLRADAVCFSSEHAATSTPVLALLASVACLCVYVCVIASLPHLRACFRSLFENLWLFPTPTEAPEHEGSGGLPVMTVLRHEPIPG